MGAGLAGYSWMLAGAAPFTAAALLMVLLPGAAVAVIACRFPPARISPPEHIDAIGFSYWAVCIAAGFEWEAAAFRDNSLWWHPSLTVLVNQLTDARPLKSAAVAGWLLAGWALVRRLGRDDHPHHHDRRLRVPDRCLGRT
jgi:hypothetical protein